MATLSTINPNQVFLARSFKRVGDKFWVNNYELRYVGNTPVEDTVAYLSQVANIIANHELNIHTVNVVVDRVVVSTIEPDGVPYNPLSFFVKTINLPGNKSLNIGDAMLPLSTCLLVKRVVSFGRAGNVLYRGVLRRSDGTLTPEGFAIGSSTVTSLESAFSTFRTNMESSQNTEFVLARLVPGSSVIQNVRRVTDFSVRALTTTKKLYNRYFDVP